MTDIKTTLDQLMMLQHSREADIKSLEESYQTSLQEMNRVRKKINAALDELEMATFMHLGEAVTSLKEKLKTELEKCTDMYETAESFRNAVCDIGDKKNELIFLAHKKWLDKKRQLNSFLKQKRSQAYACSVSFQGSIDIERYLSTLSCLGKVLYEKQSDSDHALTVIDKKECIVNCGDDTNVRCGITGICCISDGQIIITDWNNKNVKLVDRQYKIISQYDVSSYVFDVCRTAPFEVAVTVEDNKNTHEVQFISVHEGTLVIQRKFKVQHACIGIAHHHGELYVTSRDALYKYSSSGERLSKLYEDTSTYGAVFKCAVNQTGEIIYVTSYSRCALLAIDKDGTVLSIFIDPELAQPWNDYVTAHGHVLVCGRNSNTVIQVDSRARRKISTLLRHIDGVHLPLSVGFTKETGSLIVGQWDNNKLLICTTN
ncbi:uncharacterized protein LOC127845596 [Dreissena polymorpha]|nr:uncharacterized protein LOC127845596 [Dreissena polymorpha]